MALTARSKFIYSFEITEFNNSLDFKESASGGELQATLRFGYYSLTDLLKEIKRAMEEVDLNNTYTVTAIRNVGANAEVRVRIQTSGSYLDLLFGTGSRKDTSIASTIGFLPMDYTGNTIYQANSNCGIHLISTLPGYTFIDPNFNKKIFGSVNISASGQKEAIVHVIQKFAEITFRYEDKTKITNEWISFLDWAIQQRPFEFVPEIINPNTYYNVTLESTPAEGKGLGYYVREMLPDFPNLYEIANLKMRVKED